MGGTDVSPVSAVADASHPSYPASYACDEVCANMWYEDSGCPHWIYFDCGEGRVITWIHLAWQIGSAGDDYDVEGSNDTANWDSLLEGLDDTGEGSDDCSNIVDVELPEDSEYRYIRLYIASSEYYLDQPALREFLFDWTEPGVATPVIMHHYNTINKIIRG